MLFSGRTDISLAGSYSVRFLLSEQNFESQFRIVFRKPGFDSAVRAFLSQSENSADALSDSWELAGEALDLLLLGGWEVQALPTGELFFKKPEISSARSQAPLNSGDGVPKEFECRPGHELRYVRMCILLRLAVVALALG